MERSSEHELATLVDEAAKAMAARYARMRKRSREDPGTAGDEGEEDWAQLLRAWLPRSYNIRTKGRILFPDGRASRQVDVVVLSPSYPRGLLDNEEKLYIGAGVLAAFECKTTLRLRDVPEVMKRSTWIGELARGQDTPVRKPLFGLLAHTAEIKRKNYTT